MRPPSTTSGSASASPIRRTRAATNPTIPIETGGPDYFKTFGIPVIRGRAFNDSDREKAPAVLIVSESVGLFGFMETGYRSAIIVSITLEVATIVLLLSHLVLRLPSAA